MVKKRRIKTRFYVVLAAIVAAVAGVVILITSSGGGNELEYGTLSFQSDIHTALVRDEKVVNAEGYSKLNFFANEGQRVNTGEKIVEVYAWGFSESSLQDLLTLQQKIKDYQVEMLKDVVGNQELNDLNTAVLAASNQAREIVRGEGASDMLAVERNMKKAMEDRRMFLKDTAYADQTLNDMYSEEAPMVATIEGWKRDFMAEGSGMVSFYFDAYENMFSLENMGSISLDQLTLLFRGTLQKPAESRTERPLYRLVDTTKWYCLFGTGKKEKYSLAEGVTVSIAFEGYYDKPYRGTVLSAERKDEGTTYILEMNEDLGPFLAVRQAKATIKQDFQGFLVPNSALVVSDGRQGINIKEGNTQSFFPAKVLFKNERESIIEAADESKPLYAGMRIVK